MCSKTFLLCWWEGLGLLCLFQLRVGDPSGSFSNLKKAKLEWWCLIPSQLQGDSFRVWKLPTLQPEVGLTVVEAQAAFTATHSLVGWSGSQLLRW